MIRIGILIKPFDKLKNWELRIIEEIKTNPSFELCLLIKDGRKHINDNNYKLKRIIRSKNPAGKLLFRLQAKIESKINSKKRTVSQSEIIQHLHTIACINLTPKRKGHLDIFNTEDADAIKKYNLDVILRHEFKIIRGDILYASKFGIWSFHHGDNAINRGGPAGFWEIILNQPVIGVTLQQLTPELDGGLIIDKGFYNTYWSFYKNNKNILEESVYILFKNLRKIEHGKLKVQKSPVYYNPLYRVPSLSITLKYIATFYVKLIYKLVKKILTKFFAVRYNCWTLFIGRGAFLEAPLFRLKPVTLPKDKFWADPFLFKYKNEYYVFFENYSYKKNAAKISCGKIKNKEIIDVRDVLDLKYHLSYPFIFSEDGATYMIPETTRANRVEIYKCTSFPDKWELFSTAFEGQSIADVTYFKDESEQRWLFLNKGPNDHNSKLYIYKINSLKLDGIQEHAMNPVIIDSRVARNAGAIFKYNDQLIRPSQNNSYGIYGYGLNLNIVKKLSIYEYKEEKLISIEPNFKKGLRGTHHLHQLDNYFIIDGKYNKK